jgi:DNA-binding response OmpR family regulator
MSFIDDWVLEHAMPLTERSGIDPGSGDMHTRLDSVPSDRIRSSINKLPVLIFNPSPVAAGILTMQLRRAGFETHMAVEGSAAVSMARGQQFASIIVIADLADAQMRMCLRELRDAEPQAWLIVIVDPPIERSRDLVRELGGNAVMDAPFTFSDLAWRLSVLAARVPPVG